MNRVLGLAIILLGLVMIYLLITGKLASALAAITAPQMVKVG